MKLKSLFLTLLIILPANILTVSCDDDNDEKSKLSDTIIGAWATDINPVISAKARVKMDKTPEVAYTQFIEYFTVDGYVVNIEMGFDKDLNQVNAEFAEGIYDVKGNKLNQKFAENEYAYNLQLKDNVLSLTPVGEGQPVVLKPMSQSKVMTYLAGLAPAPPAIFATTYSFDPIKKEFSYEILIFNKNGKLERLTVLLDNLGNIISSNLYKGFWFMNGLCLKLDLEDQTQDYLISTSKNRLDLYFYQEDGTPVIKTYYSATMYDIQEAYDKAEIHE